MRCKFCKKKRGILLDCRYCKEEYCAKCIDIISHKCSNLDDCKKLFESGADKIHLNSVLFEDLKLIDEFSKVYGSQSISIEVQTKKIENEYYS